MSCKIDNGSRNWRGMAPRPSREKIGELRADGSKREPLECAPLRFDDDLRARARVREQLLGDCAELIDRPTGAARARKCNSFDRAVAADTRTSAKQRVARDLAGHMAAVELKDDLMFRHLAQVIGIRLPFLDQAKFAPREFKFIE